IEEISPEANRQKATVQVKVKVVNPDDYLRPEMNSSVAFLSDEKREPNTAAKPVFFVPTTVVRDGAVFVYLNGRAVRRAVRVGGTTQQGLRIEEGLIGGEDLIVNPPAELKDGARVKQK
ncbi:MAG: efflux RND transporter periplasmic adaptor subunit, partial [Bryobacterales bacterium]|nr:efflux RND transporter periplasmic adaptor subunit [Bryobacterales bacterium]